MKKITFLIIFIHGIIYCQYAEVNYLKVNGENVSLENVLQKYIQIPSESGNEKNAGDFIKSVCHENGLTITNFGNENGMYNFAASIFPLSDKKPNIIFLNHIDVVPESNGSKFKAYSGKIIDGKVHGRGAIDNKGAAIMQLFSIIKYLNSPSSKNSKHNITFLSVSCEESQCDGGVKFVIDNYLDLLNPVVVIGEGPSELTSLIEGEFKYPIFGISLAHKRAFWLNLELSINTSGHGSITPLEYANKEMVTSLNKLVKKKNRTIFNELNTSFLKTLGTHKKGLEKMILKNPKLFKPLLVPQLRKQPELFALFSNTITLTNIYTDNHSYNKIPTKIGAYLDCRLLPLTDEVDFLNEIKKRLKKDSIKITVVKNMPKTKPSITNNMYYKNLSQAIEEKYPTSKVIPIMLPNINDLGAFRAKGIPAYASIPVYLSRDQVEGIHNKNESISISSLYDGANVYFDFLTKIESDK